MYNSFYDIGYQIFDNVLTRKEVDFYKKSLLEIYDQQKEEIGSSNLRSIGEENIVRSPFLYDASFIKLFYNDFVCQIVEQILGKYAILSLQNAILLKSKKKHHQSFFHRDLIHQNFTSSDPLAINIYYCLDDYGEKNGGTVFIPKSQKSKNIVNMEGQVTPEVKAGSVILFDSMLYHKAGNNLSDRDRFGINHMITLPFIKQQIRYPSTLSPFQDQGLNRLLGFESKEYLDVKDFRNYRLNRKEV